MVKKLSLLLISLVFLLSSSLSWAGSYCGQFLEKEVWGGNLLSQYQPFSFADHPITIGIEVEGTVPRKVTTEQVIRIVRSAIKKFDPSIVVSERIIADNVIVDPPINLDELKFTLKKGDREMTLALVDDFSIKETDTRVPLEINSPIIEGPEDLELFFTILKALSGRAGVQAEPGTAGVHVHVGFPEATEAELLFLANLFAALEDDLYDFFSVMPSRSNYAAKVGPLYAEALDLSQDPRELFIRRTFDKSTRKRGFNLLSIKRHGTVEFRLFNSTTSPFLIKAMVDFAQKLGTAVREQDPRLVNFLEQHAHECKLPLTDLAKALDMKIHTQPYLRKMFAVGRAKAEIKEALSSTAAKQAEYISERMEPVRSYLSQCNIAKVAGTVNHWVKALKALRDRGE